jgi:tRNA pseudouridine55 synthase
VKRAAGTKKAGHTGTLDKFATGLLLVCTGWCTRIIPWFVGMDKKYDAVFRFGQQTETLDPEGIVVHEAPLPTRGAIESVLDQFRGRISQIPPVYSAVHTGGQRAYQLARQGKEVELKPRDVQIFQIQLTSFDPPNVGFSFHCSKGTYIRSLARDIAVACGSRAYVVELRRSSIGPFSVDGAVQTDCIDRNRDISPAEDALGLINNFKKITVPKALTDIVQHGGRLPDDIFAANPEIPVGKEILLVDQTGKLLAIAGRSESGFPYRLVVPN